MRIITRETEKLINEMKEYDSVIACKEFNALSRRLAIEAIELQFKDELKLKDSNGECISIIPAGGIINLI